MFQQHKKKDSRKRWKISWEDWRSRVFGDPIWPFRMVVETEADYLFLLDKEQEAEELRGKCKVY